MTRLVWVVIFAVLVTLLAVWSMKTLQSGSKLTGRLAEVQQAHDDLVKQYPDSRFKLQLSSPKTGIRNIVVTVQPNSSDSAFLDRMADSTITIIRNSMNLSGLDSIVVAVFDRPFRTAPAR
jgi:hypothetical protein